MDLKIKTYLLKLKKKLKGLSRELTELQTNKVLIYLMENTTIYDISPNAITILAFDDNYYLKRKRFLYINYC